MNRYLDGAHVLGALPLVTRPGAAAFPVRAVPARSGSQISVTPKPMLSSKLVASPFKTAALPVLPVKGGPTKPPVAPKPAPKPTGGNAATVARMKSSGQKALSVASKIAAKSPKFSAKLSAAGNSLVKKAATIHGLELVGIIVGDDMGDVLLAILQSDATDATSNAADAGNTIATTVQQLTTLGRTDLVNSGTAIYNQIASLLNAFNPDDVSTYAAARDQGTDATNAASAWQAKANAALSAGGVTSSTSTAAAASAAPQITAVSDVTNPTANNPPAPSPYGGVATGGANPGDQVSITGSGFTGTTSVMFTGVPAQFSVVSPTQITATVPQGAQTGQIQVINPLGTATSPGVFYVNPAASASPYSDSGGGGGGSFGGGGSDPGDPGDVDWGDGSDADSSDSNDLSDMGLPDAGDGGTDGDGDIDWGDDSASDSLSGDDVANAVVLSSASKQAAKSRGSGSLATAAVVALIALVGWPLASRYL